MSIWEEEINPMMKIWILWKYPMDLYFLFLENKIKNKKKLLGGVCYFCFILNRT